MIKARSDLIILVQLVLYRCSSLRAQLGRFAGLIFEGSGSSRIVL